MLEIPEWRERKWRPGDFFFFFRFLRVGPPEDKMEDPGAPQETPETASDSQLSRSPDWQNGLPCWDLVADALTWTNLVSIAAVCSPRSALATAALDPRRFERILWEPRDQPWNDLPRTDGALRWLVLQLPQVRELRLSGAQSAEESLQLQRQRHTPAAAALAAGLCREFPGSLYALHLHGDLGPEQLRSLLRASAAPARRSSDAGHPASAAAGGIPPEPGAGPAQIYVGGLRRLVLQGAACVDPVLLELPSCPRLEVLWLSGSHELTDAGLGMLRVVCEVLRPGQSGTLNHSPITHSLIHSLTSKLSGRGKAFETQKGTNRGRPQEPWTTLLRAIWAARTRNKGEKGKGKGARHTDTATHGRGQGYHKRDQPEPKLKLTQPRQTPIIRKKPHDRAHKKSPPYPQHLNHIINAREGNDTRIRKSHAYSFGCSLSSICSTQSLRLNIFRPPFEVQKQFQVCTLNVSGLHLRCKNSSKSAP